MGVLFLLNTEGAPESEEHYHGVPKPVIAEQHADAHTPGRIFCFTLLPRWRSLSIQWHGCSSCHPNYGIPRSNANVIKTSFLYPYSKSTGVLFLDKT